MSDKIPHLTVSQRIALITGTPGAEEFYVRSFIASDVNNDLLVVFGPVEGSYDLFAFSYEMKDLRPVVRQDDPTDRPVFKVHEDIETVRFYTGEKGERIGS